MAETEFAARAAELVEVGREFHRLGWVPATSGNLSVRLSDNTLAITVSGRHKGRLSLADIMRVDSEGRSLDGRQPSAETHLHASLYRRFPETRAVLHPHAPAGVALSVVRNGAVVLSGYELLKALPGVETHDATVRVPIFANDQDIPRLSSTVEAYLDATPMPVPAYLIAGHGMYSWGVDVTAAMRNLEALETLFDLELRIYRAKTS